MNSDKGLILEEWKRLHHLPTVMRADPRKRGMTIWLKTSIGEVIPVYFEYGTTAEMTAKIGTMDCQLSRVVGKTYPKHAREVIDEILPIVMIAHQWAIELKEEFNEYDRGV